ncbi:MAG: GNAT family N-acetyltransferase [Halobacteriales archaeon]
MDIDPGTLDDQDRLVELWVALVTGQRQYGSHLKAEPNREQIRTAMARHILTGTLRVAREDDRIRGFVMFDLEEGAYEQDVVRGVIQNIYVEPAARGRGIGSALLAAAEAALDHAGADVVALEVMASNEAAQRLYEREDFTPHRIEYEKAIESDTHSKEDP